MKTESQPSQQTPSQLPPQMSNHHLTQQPILSQREAPANLTRNDSHEIMLNHRLEQTRRELIRVLDDDEAAEQRRAHTNPLTIHRRRRRTLMPSNNIAPNILLLGWSILTSLSTPHILRISRAVSKPCTIRKSLFPIALRHLDGISALQLPAASQPYSLDESLDIQKTTTRCSMTPPMHKEYVTIEESDPEVQEDEGDDASISSVESDEISEIPDSPPVRPLQISPLQAVNNNPSPQPQAANNNPSPQPQAANNNLNPQPQEQTGLRLLINHGLINLIDIIDRLVVKLGPNTFTNKVVSENLLIFEAHTKETMDKLVAYFRAKRLPMTIKPVDGKARTFIIRGLNPRTPVAWIQAQLINLGFSPKGINNMQGGKPRGPTNDFRVDIIHSKSGPNILHLNKLGTFSVTVIEMTGKKIYQCFKCQKFDHRVSMCPYPGQICFRCAGNHSGKKCPKSLFSDAT
ncbi:hypothetical protein ACLKA7_005288 [Drosophila subpalustris]